MNALKHAPRGRRSAASSVITGLVCLLGLAGTAQAALVVVDPDSADNLADISNFFAGVTLSAFGGSTTDGKVYSLDPGSCCAPPTPPHAFALKRDTGLTGFWSQDTLKASLDFLATAAAIDYSTDGVFEMRAYGSTNNLLGSIDSSVDFDGTLNLVFGSASIARVEITQIHPGTGDEATLDHLVFDTGPGTVPEPGAAGLVALAGTLLALRRRRHPHPA